MIYSVLLPAWLSTHCERACVCSTHVRCCVSWRCPRCGTILYCLRWELLLHEGIWNEHLLRNATTPLHRCRHECTYDWTCNDMLSPLLPATQLPVGLPAAGARQCNTYPISQMLLRRPTARRSDRPQASALPQDRVRRAPGWRAEATAAAGAPAGTSARRRSPSAADGPSLLDAAAAHQSSPQRERIPYSFMMLLSRYAHVASQQKR
jgi:hypothetical protein